MPQAQQPFVRESGSGPAVLCLHSNASHSGQWRSLMERLEQHFHVLAADSYGAGKSPEWPSDREITLADEVALLEPVLDRLRDHSVHLVGHSYGAAIALKLALTWPKRVRSLALYEPTLFWLVDRASPRPNGVEGIRRTSQESGACLDRGDVASAARCFIDFWMGEGTWDSTPAERRPFIEHSVRNIRRWRHATFTDPATLQDLACSVCMPVLFMVGERSPLSSRSVADLVVPVLPQVRRQDFPELGHMAPVTHPGPVNEAIESFLCGLEA